MNDLELTNYAKEEFKRQFNDILKNGNNFIKKHGIQNLKLTKEKLSSMQKDFKELDFINRAYVCEQLGGKKNFLPVYSILIMS